MEHHRKVDYIIWRRRGKINKVNILENYTFNHIGTSTKNNISRITSFDARNELIITNIIL